MADTSAPGLAGTAPKPQERRLESWGEIAAYLRREIRTVQRWERNLGLPVHRLPVGKQASVFAYPSELDNWFRERESRLKEDQEDDDHHLSSSPTPPPVIANASVASTPVTPLTPAPQEPRPSPAQKPSAPKSPPVYRRKDVWLGGAALVLVAGFLLARFGLVLPMVSFQPSAPVQPSTKMRLFVRPLQTIAGDSSQSQAEFTDGLTSEMITRLGRIDPVRLGVIAPTSSKQLGGRPISELESLLKLNYVLEGSVRRVNEKVRIDVSLVSARDQTPLWSDSYTENMTDILKVQDEVAEAVAQKLLISLPPAPAPSPASVDPAGYNSYLRGRRYWSVRDLAHSVPAFEDAIAKLPNYALAHSGLAASYAIMGEAPNDAVPSTVSAPKAKAEAQRALALDATSAEAHYVLGNLAMSFDFDFPAAERELRQAIRLEPNNPTAHQWLGQFFMTQNRLPEAQAETSKALELDPVSPIFTTTRAEAFYYAHDFDSTIAQANLTLEQSPHFLLGEYWLASAYREKKMYPEALQHFRVAVGLVPGNPALLTVLGHALAVSGDRSGALAVLNQLQNLSHQRYVPKLYLAVIYIGLGDKENAFRYLHQAVDEHDDRLIYLAVEPIADPLRPDPRFAKVLARMHLE